MSRRGAAPTSATSTTLVTATILWGVWPGVWDGQVLPGSSLPLCHHLRPAGHFLWGGGGHRLWRAPWLRWVVNLGNRVTPFTSRQPPTAMWRQHWWTSLKVQAAKIRCRLQRSRPRALLPGSRSKPRRLQHLDGSSVTDDGYTWLWRARPVLDTTVANAACRLAGGVLEATGGAPTKQVTVS